jgi:GGDEF domain-containing protein
MASTAVREDPRAGYHAAHRVAAALTQPLGPVDAAVRLSQRHFLVVLPGASARHLAKVCDEIGEQLRLASGGYPDVSLAAQVATVVTPARPLPLTDLHLALDRSRPAGGGPWFAGTTANGDRIVMAPADGSDPERTVAELERLG